MSSRKRVPATRSDLPHVTCSICRNIPEHCRSFDKGGETRENTIPRAVSRLDVVGAPFYNQETSHSNWCLLRCPECGTYYDWDFEYEYLAGGSEDDENITRLSQEDGERKARGVAEAVADARARFAAEHSPHRHTLLHSADPAEVGEAASWLFSALNYGNDLTDLLPDLLEAWRRPEAQGDAASSLQLIFFVYGSRSRENLAALRAAIAAADPARRPKMDGLLRICENALAEAEASKAAGSA